MQAVCVWCGRIGPRQEDHRGGQLLDDGADIAAAIREVGEECGLPDSVIRDCTADLPAEEI
jgi:8-oxo-dGTP pyrophosphatase MutT (NUDIX family)